MSTRVLVRIVASAVAVVVALCAWEIVATLTDPSIPPASKTNEVITSQVIEEKVRAIDLALRSGGAPQLKPVPPYLEDLRARVGYLINQPRSFGLNARFTF